ncbi:finger matrin-type 5 [Octopus vulgaris]|uniref:Zinc finger matrin-type protein 5 n=1 Tax=Octopus vulgaris TaxID=6645 RepID=A0AA36BWR6_OCTVU|nr:finger matrin-type 5 [Octopus vulgaris]
MKPHQRIRDKYKIGGKRNSLLSTKEVIMGKRYYCDFCDKSFADLPNNRKKHINGSLHQRMRKQHYDAFRDAESILAEEAHKIPCKQLLRTGTCNFGPNCRFSHLTADTRLELEMEIWAKKEEAKQKLLERKRSAIAPTFEDWLEKRAKRPKKKSFLLQVGLDSYLTRALSFVHIFVLSTALQIICKETEVS